MKVALIDADLLDGGTRHPNLALLKLSGWHKGQGDEVQLVTDYSQLELDLFSYGWRQFDKIAVSKVFTKSQIPALLQDLIDLGKAECGGTGFFEVGGPVLPDEVEHHMPDYGLYDAYIAQHPEGRWDDYQLASIGFTTRGCFRQCPYCVNRHYTRVVRHARVREFLDPNRPRIFLWDDNFMAAGETVFNEVLDELAETGKRFQFRQGLDVRLMTRKKAERLAASRYFGDFIFAFDHVDEPTVKATMRGLQVWREHCQKSTKVYVLSGFDSQDEHDIFSVFLRIKLLMGVQCVPYITRFEKYVESPYRSVYVQLARWCNQTALFKKKSFMEFLEMAGNEGALRGVRPFMERFPVFCDEFFNLKYEEQ